VRSIPIRDLLLSLTHRLFPRRTGSYPAVSSHTGDWALSPSHSLDWSIPLVGPENTSGSLEFTVGGDDVSAFFPIKVSFVGQSSLAGIKVASVAKVEGDGNVVFSTDSMLTVDDYHVV
jgi:hypothetical protein